MATVDSQAEDKKEYTSFWDRLTAGNIDDVSDDKNSAYQRFNPKAKAAREEAESMKAGASAAAEAGISYAESEDDKPAPVSDVKAEAVAKNDQEAAEFSAAWKEATELALEPLKSQAPEVKPVVRKAIAKPAAKPAAQASKPAAQAAAPSMAAKPAPKAPMAMPNDEPTMPMITRPSANDHFQADGQVKGSPARPAPKPAAAPKAERQVMRIDRDELGKNNAFMGAK